MASGSGLPQPSRKRITLIGRIRQLMEFYFGDANLDKDRFLGEKIREDPDGFVPISILLTFNKLRSLTTDEHMIRDAVRGSSSLELSADGLRVRRTQDFQDLGPTDVRTLYVENLPPFVDHDWIKCKFAPFGKVLYVSLPKFKTTKTIKGFAFVEFDSAVSVHDACEYFSNASMNETTCFEKEAALPVEPSVTSNDFDEDELAAQHGRKRKREEADQESAQEPIPEIAIGNKPESKAVNVSKRLPPNEKKKSISRSKKLIAGLLPLKVMTKLDWMDLRNRYLDMQKASFKALKQKLKIMDVSDSASDKATSKEHDHREEALESDEEMTDHSRANSKPFPESPKKPALIFTPGVIIHLTLKTAVNDKKKIVQNLRVVPHVQFVDVTSETEVFLRCDSLSGTLAVIDALSIRDDSGCVRLLEKEEEIDYWKKIQSGAKERVKPNHNHRRGKAKVIEKAEQKKEASAKNTHIKFSDME